ncbi:MAG: hypothetical protein ACXWSD_09430 [Bdellovibrionota bacterium]
MKFIFSILCCALLLSACGKLQSDKITPPGSGPIASTITLSHSDLLMQCSAKGGAMSTDGTLCLARTTASLPSGASGRVDIDPNFYSGKYLVASGAAGTAEIVLNGRHLSDINVRMLTNQGNGSLQFNVLTTSGQTGATAYVYACYDQNMHSVFCNNGVIPH